MRRRNTDRGRPIWYLLGAVLIFAAILTVLILLFPELA